MNWKRLFIWFIYVNQRFYVVRIIRCICAKIKTVVIKSVADLMSLYALDVCRSCCEKNLFQKLSSVTDGKKKKLCLYYLIMTLHTTRGVTRCIPLKSVSFPPNELLYFTDCAETISTLLTTSKSLIIRVFY